MGSGLFEWMQRHTNSGYFNFLDAAESLKKSYGHTEDIEELLTRVDECIFDCPEPTAEQRSARGGLVNHDKPALIEAIRQWFTEIRQQPAESYRLFAQRIVQPADVIISFNYDVSLERELKLADKWQIGDGYDFRIDGLADASPVNLLKLHGSANWWAPVPVMGGRPLVDSSELRFLGYPTESDPLFPKGGMGAIPPMIMPARCKKFYFDTSLGQQWKAFWDSRWHSAKLALAQSERIVICGYSLPPVDERACQLLLGTASSARIEVCCGSDTERTVQRFRNCNRDAFAANQELFQDWVGSRALPAA
jgi:hypothetical protein